MGYIITICFIVAIYILAIWGMKYISKPKLVNALASLCVFFLYLCVVNHTYKSVGLNDWNFRNTLPTANVSPFMFSAMPLVWILPQKAKKYFLLLISLLSVGMFCSAILSCAYNVARSYAFHASFLADYAAHVILSLWGIYLVKSKEVNPNKRDCIISGSLILGTALTMLLLNVILDTSFFGLSLNGKHSIYNAVLVESSALSAILYLIGLISVLFLGYIFCKILNRKTKFNNC